METGLIVVGAAVIAFTVGCFAGFFRAQVGITRERSSRDKREGCLRAEILHWQKIIVGSDENLNAVREVVKKHREQFNKVFFFDSISFETDTLDTRRIFDVFESRHKRLRDGSLREELVKQHGEDLAELLLLEEAECQDTARIVLGTILDVHGRPNSKATQAESSARRDNY